MANEMRHRGRHWRWDLACGHAGGIAALGWMGGFPLETRPRVIHSVSWRIERAPSGDQGSATSSLSVIRRGRTDAWARARLPAR